MRSIHSRKLTVYALAFTLSLAAANAAAASDHAVVRIETGIVRGLISGAHTAFHNIPYAKPPVSDLRWRAPQPATAWTGERDATRPGKACPQVTSVFTPTLREFSEDCLQLNVYTPASAQPGDALPVIVWLHGGALMTGSAVEYPAGPLAEIGKAVVVTVNYRLGMLGFLALPELHQAEPRLNFGLQDQQAALRWVQRNIAQFGGDKDRVTIAGESAGGQSVLVHMVSPLSSGLFHRAIVQSAAPTGLFNSPASLEQAYAQSAPHAQAAGCAEGPERLACLRGKSVDTLINAVPYVTDFRKASGGLLPVVDGELYPAQVFERMKAGKFEKVPLLIGMNRDELQALVALAFQIPQGRPPTEEEYQSSLSSFGTPAEAAKFLTSFYKSERYGSPQNALSSLLSDFLFICPNHRATKALAKQIPTYAYRFDDRNAPNILDVPGLKMMAYHGAEVPYLFEVWTDRPLSSNQLELANRMKRYWGNFAATGDPNRSAGSVVDKSLPSWPRFNALTASYKVLDTDRGTRELILGALPREHQCLLWDVIEAFIPSPTTNP